MYREQLNLATSYLGRYDFYPISTQCFVLKICIGFSKINLLRIFFLNIQDASQVYGTTKNKSDQLRLMSNGLLRTSEGVLDGKSYLPFTLDSQSDVCSIANDSIKCFVAGDSRVAENLGLASIHTLFMREHNRIATELSKVNPHWNDEKIFNEARRVMIAVYQHIIYNEWIPSTIGNDPNFPLLAPMPLGSYFDAYDPKVFFFNRQIITLNFEFIKNY